MPLMFLFVFYCFVFQLPFCVLADHKTKSVVISIRGSMSLRDIFTDLTSIPEKLELDGLPENTMVFFFLILFITNEIVIHSRFFYGFP